MLDRSTIIIRKIAIILTMAIFTLFSGFSFAADDNLCIKAGKEQAIQNMFNPYVLGEDIVDGYNFSSISIEKDRIVIGVSKNGNTDKISLVPARQADNKFSRKFTEKINNNKALDLLFAAAENSPLNPFEQCISVGKNQEFKINKKFIAEYERKHETVHPTTLIVFLILFIITLSASYIASKKKHTKSSGFILVISTIFLLLAILEFVLVFSVSYWAIDMPIGTNCYISNPRGYFKETISKEKPELKAFCVAGRQQAVNDCENGNTQGGILALGDSFTQAIGVFFRDSWPKRLENLLKSSSKNIMEVTNCGIGGSDITSAIKRYNLFGKKHNPKIVIYAFVLNDVPMFPIDNYSKNAHDIGFQYEHSDRTQKFSRNRIFLTLSQHSAIARFFLERFERKRIAQSVLKSYQITYSLPVSPNLTKAFDELQSLKKMVEENGGKFMVTIWPLIYNLRQYPFKDAHKIIANELKKRNIEILDMLPEFSGYNAEDLQVHPTDLHPNEKAQKIAAGLIFEKLKEMKWIK